MNVIQIAVILFGFGLLVFAAYRSAVVLQVQAATRTAQAETAALIQTLPTEEYNIAVNAVEAWRRMYGEDEIQLLILRHHSTGRFARQTSLV